MITNASTTVVTADGVVASAGQAVRVFAIHIISGAGGGAVVSLRSGSTVGGTVWITETGTASTGKTFPYGTQGVLFPSGCFVDVDTNTTSVTVTYNNNT